MRGQCVGTRARVRVVVLACLLAGTSAGARSPAAAEAAVDPRDLAAFVDGFVESRMASEHVVGVTVSVVHRGELIFARGYGYADMEAQRPVDPSRTLFRPGSISKTFTWTAVMQLVERGLVDLNRDVRSYLPNLEIPATFEEPITLAHLMAHTPGFEESAMGHLFENDPVEVLPLPDYLNLYQPARVRPPGAVPAYSNYGAALAGLVVANVSGMPWEDYADEHLLEPLGMTRSTFREPWGSQRGGAMSEALQRAVSRGYARHAGGYRAGSFEFIGHVGPAGALSTTATDMARWMLAHLDDGRLGETRILERETAQRMHSRHFGMDPEMPGMAHGFIESDLHGYRAIGHGGGTVHFVSDLQLVPKLELGVFISTNTSGGGGALVRDFARSLVARYFPPGPAFLEAQAEAEPEGSPVDYAGTYLSTRRPYTTVERLFMTQGAAVSATEDGRLVAVSPMGESRLEPLGGDRFRSVETGEPVRFLRDEEGRIRTLLLHPPVMVLEKVRPLATPGVRYSILGLAALVMGGAIVGAWLRRNRPVAQSPGEAWAVRVLIAAAGAWLAFYGLAVISLAPIAEDFANVFYAFPPPGFVAALGLGLVAAVLTMSAVLLLYPVWRAGNWPRWRRIRHTGVVLAAAATLLVLHDLNAIGFNYLPS